MRGYIIYLISQFLLFLGNLSESTSSNHETFTSTSLNMSNNRVDDDQMTSSVDNTHLRHFYARKTTANYSDSDVTSDDEFILYVDDDKKHILK